MTSRSHRVPAVAVTRNFWSAVTRITSEVDNEMPFLANRSEEQSTWQLSFCTFTYSKISHPLVVRGPPMAGDEGGWTASFVYPAAVYEAGQLLEGSPLWGVPKSPHTYVNVVSFWYEPHRILLFSRCKLRSSTSFTIIDDCIIDLHHLTLNIILSLISLLP